MKLTELRALSLGRDSYIPAGEKEGRMLLTCMDGRTDGQKPITQFFEYAITDDELKKYPGEKIVGHIVSIQLDRAPMIPFAGAAMKLTGSITEVK